MAVIEDLDVAEFAEQFAFASRLVKSADLMTRERAQGWLDQLNRLATVDLEKVGPKGYIHGWIFVGAPGVGGRVYHPHHGHGTVTRHGKRTVEVRFDSGKEHAFEHSVDARRTGDRHGDFAERVHARSGKPIGSTEPQGAAKPAEHTPAKGSYEHLTAASGDEKELRNRVRDLSDEQIQAHIDYSRNLPAGERVARYNTHSAVGNALVAERKRRRKAAAEKPDAGASHLDEAQTAIAEGRHADAINHLTAAASEAPNKKTRDQITAMRSQLAARTMGKPVTGPLTGAEQQMLDALRRSNPAQAAELERSLRQRSGRAA